MHKEESNDEIGAQNAPISDVPVDILSKDPNAKIYENREHKKILRIVTVMAYLFSVSFVGILLSAYYMFLWEPPNSKLIEKGHLREDSQLQFLIAESTLEKTDLRKKESMLLKSGLNRTYKPLLSHIAHNTYDDVVINPNKIGLTMSHKKRLNAILQKLRQSFVETLRTQKNRSLSHEMIPRKFDHSFIRVIGKTLSSTKKADYQAINSISGYSETSRKKIAGKNTKMRNIYLHPEFANSTRMLAIKGTSLLKSTAILGNETNSSRRFDRKCDQAERIVCNGVFVDSSRDSKLVNNSKFYQVPDDSTVKPTYAARSLEETQIEKMNAKSTTIDNKLLEQPDLSTTQRQKSFWEILTETANIGEIMEFTSISIAQEYRNNFTSTASDDESIT